MHKSALPIQRLISKSALRLSLAAALAVTCTAALNPAMALPSFLIGGFTIGHRTWVDSPLTDDQQKRLEQAGRAMKSAHWKQAADICQQVLDTCTDVPKCLAIANYTESVGLPMIETRRACLNKALSLSQSTDDMILIALKARHYQFFEVTREAVHNILGNARTMAELIDVAHKCEEVALNDIAHLAMEKAYTGIKDDKQVWDYMAQCKRLGMEDVVRKTLKDLIDDQQDSLSTCDVLMRAKVYSIRDMNRYGLRRAMDDAKTVEDMQAIFEVARQVNENDIANRASYFVRKGKLIQQIKNDRANYEAQLRAWREGIDIDTARAQDPTLNQGGQKKGNDGSATGF